MKKILFALLAVLTLVLTGCKIDNAKVTVSVKDTAGNPVADRYVFYTDKISAITDLVLPSPEAMLEGDDGTWQYGSTNAQGTVTFNIIMVVPSLTYEFVVYDLGNGDPIIKEVKVKRGEANEVEFEVNK